MVLDHLPAQTGGGLVVACQDLIHLTLSEAHLGLKRSDHMMQQSASLLFKDFFAPRSCFIGSMKSRLKNGR
jgi:hypothetical protein